MTLLHCRGQRTVIRPFYYIICWMGYYNQKLPLFIHPRKITTKSLPKEFQLRKVSNDSFFLVWHMKVNLTSSTSVPKPENVCNHEQGILYTSNDGFNTKRNALLQTGRCPRFLNYSVVIYYKICEHCSMKPRGYDKYT